jgi:hypothetical protein
VRRQEIDLRHGSFESLSTLRDQNRRSLSIKLLPLVIVHAAGSDVADRSMQSLDSRITGRMSDVINAVQHARAETRLVENLGNRVDLIAEDLA